MRHKRGYRRRENSSNWLSHLRHTRFAFMFHFAPIIPSARTETFTSPQALITVNGVSPHNFKRIPMAKRSLELQRRHNAHLAHIGGGAFQ